MNIVAVLDHVFHRFPFDLLIQVSATQLSLFLCIPFVLMATDRAREDAMYTSLPGSPPLSSNVGSPHASGHDLDGMGTRSGNTLDEKLDALLSKFVHFETQIAQIPALTTWMSRVDSHISKTLGDFATRLTEMEQNFSAPTAPTLEQVDGSTAAGSHGPGSSDDHRNTRRRLDTFSSTEDEQSRSAVSLRFPCEQYLKGITKWIDTLWGESKMQVCNKNLSEFTARQVPCQSDSFLKHEANARTLLLDIRMMVFLTQTTVPSAATITVRQSISIEDREIGTQFAPLWKVLAEQLKVLFLEEDDEGVFILPALDARSQLLSIKDRRNGIGKPMFKLAPLGSGQTFTLVTPDLSVPGISPEVLQRVLSQANRPHVSAPSPLRFFAAWRVEAFFFFLGGGRGSCFDGFYTWRPL